ncbi:hypothetical protein [Amycolatopsis regifaucium]|uniref:DUF998 domain-containing protein n=1 Tax=Amycolatopsis regifaucium TaxID=546365 RepID=A0A154MRZ7_9PSEU|nr:hypothetical protein [Amycolatopsis regifaucium]KZB86870.1 hypothetical protein AVL48_24845 [Amycolatopsis regifaucium]OKA09301.1 DUF998 domain-containing protein [Amycolatopsis regifaucium]SFH57916.1 hypothetical protein SAMN04489731_10596 [Amycolatopsis regifaucium]
MSPRTVSDNLVHNYLFLRRAIGFLGVALPFVLIFGKLLVDGGGLLNSISGYYYSGMRDVWVGTMCAIGVFLLSYRGYGRIDDIAGNIAAVAAVGVALFPTTPAHGDRTDEIIGMLHLGFAAVFFLTLAFFCIVLFTKSDKAIPGGRKPERNRLYVTSGVLMLVCLALIVLCGLFFDEETRAFYPALWLESAAILAFGVAWLTKGGTLLPDKPAAVSGVPTRPAPLSEV